MRSPRSRARTCRTRWPPPIPASACNTGPTTSSPRRSIPSSSGPCPRRAPRPAWTHLARARLRIVTQDRNAFAACMAACGEAGAMVTGAQRNYFAAFEEVTRVIAAKPGHRICGYALLLSRGRSVFIADTPEHALPGAEELADIAMQSARRARQMMGQAPRVALLSYSNFGNPLGEAGQRVRDAVAILDARKGDFEYDGAMSAGVAPNLPPMRERYPFCPLSGPAPVLVPPA